MRAGVFSPGIMRIPHLPAFLDADKIVFQPGPLRRVDCVVGWGRKPNTTRARKYAEREGVPFLALEDGFVRSVGLGVNGDPPLSIVVDDLGVYYDATRPSRLETMLREGPIDTQRAGALIDRIRTAKISKYNDAPVVTLPTTDRPRVLVVDQTAGDLSVRLGLGKPSTFDEMLRAALEENPGAEIVLKTHPDVSAGKRGGHFGEAIRHPRVRALTEPANPIALVSSVDRVYVVSSLLGFEALLAGKPVTCFGAPFYAGWGATDDRADIPSRRGVSRSVEEIFAAAYLSYARYIDPERGERCDLERVVEHLALQREIGERNTGTSVCIGFSAWKRSFLPSFLAGPGANVRFESSSRPATRAVVWGTRSIDAKEVWRMEDGFLRSVGLGSDLYAPASLVVDRTGIYYDPQTPSDLETLLQTAELRPDQIARAARLRARIVDARISKYNVGGRAPIGSGNGRKNVLVVGQVEDDASIQRGTIDIRTNEALLRAARIAEPDAWLMYKPHPDVVSGNRRDSLPLHVARRLCDEVIVSAPLPDCLGAARSLHTMTSLSGFEALLRGLDVYVYGQPFYAGWGLTIDRHPHPRRTRRLTVDELVLCTLILYPRYVHPRTKRFTTPEAIVELLAGQTKGDESWLRHQTNKLMNLAKLVAHVP